MRKLLTGLLVVAAALVVACGGSANAGEPSPTIVADPNSISDPQGALDAARAIWANEGGDHYEMTFNWQCFCIVDFVQRVDLEIRAGAVADGVVTDSGAALTGAQLVEYQTVVELFDFIQDAIDRDAAEIRVTYGPAGYPAEAWIDYDLRIADEERGFFIHALEVS